MRTLHQILSGNGIDSYSNFCGDMEDIKNYYLLMSITRDSDILSESNWHCAIKELGGESKTVKIVRFGHWACGWVEHLLISPDDVKAVEIAESIESALSEYPVLNDMDYSEREYAAKCEYWNNMNMRERIKLCANSRISIFSARSESLPSDLYQYIDIY